MVCLRNICINTLHKGDDHHDDDDDNNNNNNNVDDTDGTMTALTDVGMAEALNVHVQFPLGTLVPTKSLVESLPMGVQTIMSTDLTITKVTDTFFFT